ncbi:MAG: efflux RND transporter periplasmic adaptor subunit [Bacteroidetes bacterium]|nr:efflux RND transporter periplasmic adaptor subunit [Bacteroidota bacterium]
MKKYIILLVSSALLISCGSETKTDNTATIAATEETTVQLTDAQLKNISLTTGKLEIKSISSILKVNGIIDVPPQNLVSISVPLGGFLKSTKLLPGMHIFKGEVIAIIEDQQYIKLQQDYLTTAVNLKYTEADYNRQKDLNQSKAISDKAFQQAEVDYTNQKITLKSLNEQLKLIGINPEKLNENTISRSISITSPIDGYVSKVNVNIGKYVNSTDVLFELVNPQDIHLGLTVFEKDLDKLFIGQKVFAYTNTNPGKKYPCEIILIGKDLSDERSVEVHCHFEKYDKSLIPGMFMNAELDVEPHNAFVIPNDGLVRFEGKEYVFTQLEYKKYEMQQVDTKNTENGFTQINFADSTDIRNKIFVTKGAYTLLMKMKNTAEEE